MSATDHAARPFVAHAITEVLLVAVLPLGFRTFNLLSLPMFVDEGTYLYWALDIWDQRTREALMIPVVADGKQPLFMWLAGAASYLFSDPLLAGRMVSALAGVLSAVGIYLAGHWLAGGRVGLLAGLLYAVMPFDLFYDPLALVEALLNAAGIWTFALSVFIAGRACTALEARSWLALASAWRSGSPSGPRRRVFSCCRSPCSALCCSPGAEGS